MSKYKAEKVESYYDKHFTTIVYSYRGKTYEVKMLKGYDNSEAIDILNKRLFEYNPLGFSLDAMIARTCPKA